MVVRRKVVVDDEIPFEILYAQEIDTLRTAFEVIEPQDQKELVKWIPDMIKYLISKKIIENKSKS